MRLVAVFGLAAAVTAQAVVCHPVDDARRTVFAVRLLHGIDDDGAGEVGVARVLVECRLARAAGAVPDVGAHGSHVGGDVTIAFVEVDAEDWQRGVAFVRALLDAKTPLAADAIRLATARAALIADDAEWLYPGPVLQSRARRAMVDGRGARAAEGSARALQQLTSARVRELLGAPVTFEVAVFGAVPAAVRELRFAGDPPAAVRPIAAAARRAVTAEPELVEHPRVDAPFVVAAFAAPSSERWPALAIALEVARLRTLRQVPRKDLALYALARAPVVGWSWLDADPVVLFCRRGHVDDAPDAVFAQLEAQLADLRQRPPSERELERARRALIAETAPLPWGPEVTASPGRVLTAVRARHRGITAAAIADVTADSAHAALRDVLAAGPGFRGGLIPRRQHSAVR